MIKITKRIRKEIVVDSAILVLSGFAIGYGLAVIAANTVYLLYGKVKNAYT